MTSLVKQIDKKLDGKVVGYAVFLTEDSDGTETAIKKLANDNGIEKLPLTIFEGNTGPKPYKVSQDADVTVHMWVGRKVVANHAFGKGELNDAAIGKIVAEIPTVFQK